jgi:hypothetical protein
MANPLNSLSEFAGLMGRAKTWFFVPRTSIGRQEHQEIPRIGIQPECFNDKSKLPALGDLGGFCLEQKGNGDW